MLVAELTLQSGLRDYRVCACSLGIMAALSSFSDFSRLVLCVFVIVALSSSLYSQALDPNNTNLTFMLITSFGQFGFNSSGGLPAAEMALEDINNNPDVLPGYNLVYDKVRDSQVMEQ